MRLVLALGFLSNPLLAYPQDAGPHAQFLGGPYELLVKQGMQGAEMVFPVEIENQNAPSKLNKILPIMGSSAIIELEQFLPELVWEQYTEKSEDGGPVIKLRALGPGLEQEIWLCAEDKEKQSISSAIGGIAIKAVQSNADIVEIAAELTDSEAIGIMTVWHEKSDIPVTYVVSDGSEFSNKDASYKFKVLEYMPHYSVDTETRAITNASPEPKNPAVRIEFTQGDEPIEQWVFSRFRTHPHVPNKIPLRIEFTDFDLGSQPGNYMIVVSSTGKPIMYFVRDGKKVAEEVKFQSPYPLAKEGYDFLIDEAFSDVVLKERWKNNREQLLNPALIASIDRDGQKEQVVLELNKPEHIRSGAETMVVLFRRKVETVEHLE
jgi:hypothetical protein